MESKMVRKRHLETALTVVQMGREVPEPWRMGRGMVVVVLESQFTAKGRGYWIGSDRRSSLESMRCGLNEQQMAKALTNG